MRETYRATLHRRLNYLASNDRSRSILFSLWAVILPFCLAAVGFLLHLNLSTAGSLELLLVLVIALQLGFLQATIVSVSAVFCLNYLFTAPIFTFTVADPQNWVSLFTFETTALLVSGLSSKVRLHAANAEQQRFRAVKLYELSCAVLLIDQRRATGEQLALLIREFLQVERVKFWVRYESSNAPMSNLEKDNETSAFDTYLAGRDSDDYTAGFSQRVLRIGASTIGGMNLSGWKLDPLLADAVASLSAIAFEHARAMQQENWAEVERNAEQLRSAVLDGLAHSFKTPLTAIQTASSGLLEVGQLDTMQAELVSIIDERATMLSELTTRLLRTAALEAKEIRIRQSNHSIVDLLQKVVREQDEDIRARTIISASTKPHDDQLDAPMIELALQQLADNAAKYSAIGSPIEISVNQIASETIVCVQNIKIAGSSIKPEERTRIFERFYRGADAAYGPVGTGLGLSIVKKIAEAHGGRVWVECLDDKTRFHFAIQHFGR